MAYTIYNTDGTVLSTIAVGDVDNYSTSLELIGKNVNNYGEYYNNNLVKLLTNFASAENDPPTSPQTGQLWYNKSEKQLKIYDTSIGTFKSVAGAIVSGAPPLTYSTGSTGTIWFDEPNGQLSIWNGQRFLLVGPATSIGLGSFGILPASSPIRDQSNNVQKASLINSYGSYVGMITTSSFNMPPNSSTVYLAGTSRAGTTSSIVNGVTIFKDLEVFGKILINGWDVRSHPNVDLTSYYNITPFGTYTATMTTSSFSYTNTNYLAYTQANFEIAQSLARSFDYTDGVNYPSGSRASVTCIYNSEVSVRKFELRKLYSQQEYPYWEPTTEYSYSFTATTTSTVGQVRWLWTATTYTNIAYPEWNEVIRTDSTSDRLSGTSLNPINTGTTFYVKVTGGIPNTGFNISNPNPVTTLLPTGTFVLDSYGEWTTSSVITNIIQPVTTSVFYTYNFEFFATKTRSGSNHNRTLQFTGLRT
jgi:hypothetical protein